MACYGNLALVTGLLLCSLCDGTKRLIREVPVASKLEAPKTYTANNGYQCIMCQPGTYKTADCTGNNLSAECAKCPNKTFQIVQNQAASCEPCLQTCKTNQVLTQNCTSVSNNYCVCKPGYYFKSLGGEGEGKCLRHRTCYAGYQVLVNGTSTRDTQCESCPTGTYSIDDSPVCLNYSKCSGEQVKINDGTNKEDVICGPHSAGKHNNGVNIAAAVIVPIIVVLIVVLLVLGILYQLRKKKLFCFKEKSVLQDQKEPVKVELTDIEKAANANGGSAPPSGNGYRSIPHESPSSNSKAVRMPAVQLATFLSHNLLTNIENMRPCLRDMITSSANGRDLDPEIILGEARENNPIDVKEMLYQSVIKWMQSVGRGVTPELVVMSLQKYGYNKVADKFQQEFKEFFKNNCEEQSGNRAE